MATLDRALDDIIGENRPLRRRGGHGGRARNSPRGRRTETGGIRKPQNESNGYSENKLWVHDKFEGEDIRGASKLRGNSAPKQSRDSLPEGAAKVKVSNLHYDLCYDDLMKLFEGIGPVLKLDMIYDRAGRSEGTAFITYTFEADADDAVRQFDGQLAKGQKISLQIVLRSRLPVEAKPRSLFERIKMPDERRDTRSRDAPQHTRNPNPQGIDRYVPPERRRRDNGEAPRGNGDRGERAGNVGRDAGRGGRGRRGGDSGQSGRGAQRSKKKTAEELDAEMNDYFAQQAAQNGDAAPAEAVAENDATIDKDGDVMM